MQEKISIGNVEVLSVVDMFPPGRATSFFFPDVPENAWDPYREEQLSPAGEIVLPYCLFVLRSQGQIILADTGMGAGPHLSRGNLTGNLLNELQNIGISPDDVDIVVHTHLHADHVGWNITYEDGVARFCVIGSMYGRTNKAFLKHGEAHSRDIYRQVAIKYGLDRDSINTLININDRIPWTWLRRLALLRYLTRIAHE